MPRKELIFLSSIILLGFLDWLTTITGVLFFGATEANPLLSGLTRSSLFIFSTIKLSAVFFAGFAFYKAVGLSKPNDWHLTKRFIDGGYSLTCLALTLVVTSNLMTLLR